MQLNKFIVLTPVISLLLSASVFALEPIQINPDLIKINTIDRQLLIEPIETEVVYTDDPDIFTKLRGGLNDDGTVSLKWDKFIGPNFLWYKIIKSTEKKELIYPRDGYIDFYDTPNATAWDDDDPALGSNYYRICIITTDNKRGCSNQIEVVKEKQVQTDAQIGTNQPDKDAEPNIPKVDSQNNKGTLVQSILRFLSGNIEIIIALIALILGITGYSFATRKKQRSISKYMNQIDNTYSEFKMKSKRCEAELYRLRDIVDEELKSGKLDEGAYQLLMNRIEGYMVDVQKQIVNEKFGGLPENLKSELFNMMESGDISEKEFEKFQTLINKSELTGNEQSTLLKTVKDFQSQGEKLKRKGGKED